MRTPLRTTFQGTTPSAALRQVIGEQVEHLEHFFGRLTACHVVFKLPDGNHRTGGLYEVSVHIKMPGGVTIDVDRTPAFDCQLDVFHHLPVAEFDDQQFLDVQCGFRQFNRRERP